MSLKNRSSYPGRKKLKATWILLATVMCAIYVFRKALVVLGIQVFFHTLAHDGCELNYERIAWKGERLCISGLQMKDLSYEIMIDEVYIDFHPDYKRLYLEPYVCLMHPQVICAKGENKGSSSLLPILFTPTKRFAIKWEAQHGVIQFPCSPSAGSTLSRLYFSFVPGQETKEIGSLYLSYDPNPQSAPALCAELATQDDLLTCNFRIQENDCRRIIPLFTFFMPGDRTDWCEAQGEVEITGTGVLDSSLHMTELSCQGRIRHLQLGNESQGMHLALDLLEGNFTCPIENTHGSFWEQIEARMILEGGELTLSPEWSVAGIRSTCHLERGRDPDLIMDGFLLERDKEFPLHLEGKGSIHEDGAFWLELALNSQGDGLKTLFSFCSPEPSKYVYQIDCERASAEYLALACRIVPALSQVQCVEGSIAGKLTFCIDSEGIDQISLDACVAENIRLYFPEQKLTAFANCLKAETAWKRNKEGEWDLDQGSVFVHGGDVRISTDKDRCFLIDKIEAALHGAQDQILPSTIQAQWDTVVGKVEFKGPEADHFMDFTMQGTTTQLFSIFFPDLPQNSAQVCSIEGSLLAQKNGFEGIAEVRLYTNNLKNRECETRPTSSKTDSSGCLCIGTESVQFGLEILSAMNLSEIVKQQGNWKLTEGWFRTECLSEKTYGLLAQTFLGGMHVTGDLDCFGTFDQNHIQFSLQGQDLFFHHPLFSLHIPQMGEKDQQLLKTSGRAQLCYDLQTKSWAGEIPLAEAQFRHDPLDLSFQHVQGSLLIRDSRLVSENLSASCEGLALEADMALKLNEREGFDLNVMTTRIDGTVDNLLQVMSHFPHLPQRQIPLQGLFSSAEKGFQLHSTICDDQLKTEWSFQGKFAHLNFPINPFCSLSEGGCELSYDSAKNSLSIREGQGKLLVSDERDYLIKLDKFEWTPLASIPNVFQNLGSGNAGASDLQPTKQTMCEHMVDGDDCKDGDAGAARTQVLKHVRYTAFDFKLNEGKKEIGRLMGSFQQNPQGGWDCAFDRENTHFFGTLLCLDQVRLNKEAELVLFEMTPVVHCQDLKTQLDFLIAAGLLKEDRLFTSQLAEWHLSGDVQTQLRNASDVFTFRLESRNMKTKEMSIPHTILNGHKAKDRWTIERMHTQDIDLKAIFSAQEKGIVFSRIEGNWGAIACIGSAQYLFDQGRFVCRVDSAKGTLSALAEKGLLASNKLQGNFHAAMNMELELSKEAAPFIITGETTFALDLHAPVSLVAKSEPPARFTYSTLNGLEVSQFHLQVYARGPSQHLGLVKAGTMKFKEEETECTYCAFSLSPELVNLCIDAQLLPHAIKDLRWESFLDGTGRLAISSKGTSFQGTLKDGRYGVKDHMFPMQQIAISVEKSVFGCQFKTLFGDQALWGQMHIDVSSAPYGMIKILDAPKQEGIKALFKTEGEVLSWESVQGSAFGIDCNLVKSSSRKAPGAAVLTGSVKIDGSSLDHLLPQALQDQFKNIKLGQGYQFQGDFLFWQSDKTGFQINGRLTGQNFELMGYRFDRLDAYVDATENRLFVSNLKIEDDAGLFAVKKIDITQNPIDKRWSFSIPLLQIKELKPSSMKKIAQAQSSLKPLVIRNLSLSELHGDLNDPLSWEGRGELNFTNAFKKESTLLDIPFELIKKFGLDPGLLTPVQGEIELELRGDKFYLLNLTNAYSEGKRSHFFLTPENGTSFIDLAGKLHIDIKMQQEVVLKLTEAFTLTVRGTVDKPRYGLQY